MPILTDALVRGLSAPATGSKIFFDNGDPRKCVTGFGIRITAAGYRSFVLNYRCRGRERRLTLGAYPTWGVAAARDEAKKLRRDIDRGIDPLGERIADREAPTVDDLIQRYRDEYAARKRERSRLEDERLLSQWISPELANRKVADIRRVDIERLHAKITARGTRVRANRVLALVAKLFSLAVGWELRADNPAKGVERNHEEGRSRFLSGDELKRLVEALAMHSNQQAANAVRLLLLTGARRSEALGATWDQFDLDRGVWTKPAASTKQGRLHRVPLSAPARALLASMRATAPDATYLFAAGAGDRPITEIRHAWDAIRKAAQLDGVRLHDLRHSFASVLVNAGLSLPTIGALLGHTRPATTQRYSHMADDALRAAAEQVGAVVAGDRPAADVVPLRPITFS